MLKKILIFIVFGLFFGLLAFAYSFLKTEHNKLRLPIEAIPKSAAIIGESMHLYQTWSHLSATNLVYAQATNNAAIQKLENRLQNIDSILQLNAKLFDALKAKSIAFSIHFNKYKDTLNWDYLFAISTSQLEYNELLKIITNHIGIKGNTQKIGALESVSFKTTNENLHLLFYNPLLIITSSKDLLHESLNQLQIKESLLQNEDFITVRKNYSSATALRIYINNKNCETPIKKVCNIEVLEKSDWSENKLPNWFSFDLITKADALILSGYSLNQKPNDYKIAAKNNNYLTLLPNSVLELNAINFGNINDYLDQNQSELYGQIEKICDCELKTSLPTWLGNEGVEIKFKLSNNQTHKAIFLAINNDENCFAHLSNFGINESNPIKIGTHVAYELNHFLLTQLLGFESESSISHTALIGDYAVFSNIEGIKAIENTYQANLTTINENNFSIFNSKLLIENSQNLYFSSILNALDNLALKLNPKYQNYLKNNINDFSGLNAIAFQNIPINEYLNFVSLVITSNPNGAVNVIPKEPKQDNLLWRVTLKNKVKRAPELIKNHQTNTYEIIVQDEENVMHLISPTGKVKWSKPLHEKIMGNMNQIDLYNNNKLQLVFNTATKIYCLDINGNNVKGYPIKLPSNASNSVGVMDYENKHDYRYLIATTDKKILNYDKEGNQVKGWEFKTSKSIIINPIEHFITEGKDYLYANDIEGNIYLLERKGTTRHNVGKTIKTNFKETIFLQKGYSLDHCSTFYINLKNELEELTMNGKTQSLPIDSIKIIDLLATDFDNDKKHEFLICFENKIVIFTSSKNILFAENFDFMTQNNVRVLGAKSKYIIVENESNNAIIIYNNHFQKIKTIEGKASKLAAIGDLNNDGKDNLITIINNQEIIVYTLNPLYGI